jgi:hypothetical protein
MQIGAAMEDRNMVPVSMTDTQTRLTESNGTPAMDWDTQMLF